MLILIQRELMVEKEKAGTFHLCIPGSFNLYRVSSKEDPRYPYFMTYDRKLLFVIDRSSRKMLLRGELTSKDQLQAKSIVADWYVYNPPYKKSYY